MNRLVKWLKTAWPFFLGLGLALSFFILPVVGLHFEYFPGDVGDGRFNTYLLEHCHRFFTGQDPSLWEAPFLYPEESVITYSDNLVGSAPFYSIFRILGLDREASFQGWFVVMMLLNYACCYFFLKDCFKNTYAAVLGALVFTFSLAFHSQITHAQLFPRFPIPLAFWMGILFLRELKPVYFLGALMLVVYQFYCGVYLGFLLAVPIGFLLLFSLIHQRKLLLGSLKNIKWDAGMALGVILPALAILPLILPYIARTSTVEMSVYENIRASIPTPLSFFFSEYCSLPWGFLNETAIHYPNNWNHRLFPGALAISSLLVYTGWVVVGLFRQQGLNHRDTQPQTMVLFFTGLVTFLFFTRIGEISLYRLLFELPGFAALRGLGRIINIELLFFGIAATYLLMRLLEKFKKWTIPIFLGVCCLFVLDNFKKPQCINRSEKAMAQSWVNKLIQKMKHIPEGSIVSYEPEVIEGISIHQQLDAMLACQTLNLVAINGYTATSPNGYSGYWGFMNEAGRNYWLNRKGVEPDTIYVIH